MNRRALLSQLLAAGVSPALVSRLEAQTASPADLDEVFRTLVRAEPLPGESRIVFQALDVIRKEIESDPRVQPALGFDPEVDA